MYVAIVMPCQRIMILINTLSLHKNIPSVFLIAPLGIGIWVLLNVNVTSLSTSDGTNCALKAMQRNKSNYCAQQDASNKFIETITNYAATYATNNEELEQFTELLYLRRYVK